MESLVAKGYVEPIRQYIASGKPFLGICIGMQTLFEESAESPGVPGLGIIPGKVLKFDPALTPSVPHMGWNKVSSDKDGFGTVFDGQVVYFVHSYYVPRSDYQLTTTKYGQTTYVSAIQKDNILATQFHPEKSGPAGLKILQSFVQHHLTKDFAFSPRTPLQSENTFTKRIIACLDVRSNDQGDLVVTKGDQYDVREHQAEGKGDVRNLGRPVDLAQFYYEEGADEITFLNITSFRNCPLNDLPILNLLQKVSETVFVPLTIGGGIRDFVDESGKSYSAMDIVDAYFRAGADKVSIGSDAVTAAQQYLETKVKTGKSAIEQISHKYGNQAVVVSIDPIRVYVSDPKECKHHTVKHSEKGPNGEEYCWYQCTIKGGRERCDFDVKQLAQAVEILGAGEILLNSIDRDGTKNGFDIHLIQDVKSYVGIPVIASSGAGHADHFTSVFQQIPNLEAALAAGIFHRKEVSIGEVKQTLQKNNIPIRNHESTATSHQC